MSLKIKILILAVLPLLLLTGLVAWVSFQIQNELSIKQRQIFEDGLRASKTAELQSHLKMALSAIEPTLKESRVSDDLVQKEVKNIIDFSDYSKTV